LMSLAVPCDDNDDMSCSALSAAEGLCGVCWACSGDMPARGKDLSEPEGESTWVVVVPEATGEPEVADISSGEANPLGDARPEPMVPPRWARRILRAAARCCETFGPVKGIRIHFLLLPVACTLPPSAACAATVLKSASWVSTDEAPPEDTSVK